MFLKDEINELQCDNDVNLTTQARLTELGDMLQEAVDLIFFMEGSKYVTLACIPFALHYLYIHLEDKAGEDFGVAQARRVLREYINRRYPLLPIHFLAAYLDPRFFKFEPFVSRAELPMKLQQVKEMISARAETILQHAPIAADIVLQREEGNQEPPRKKQKSSILDRMREEHRRVASSEPIPSSMENLDEELHRYGAETQVDLDTCPLQWWKMRASKFPILSQVAMEILAIPASSAPSERVFSKLARIYTKERLSLNGDLANACLFLSFNH